MPGDDPDEYNDEVLEDGTPVDVDVFFTQSQRDEQTVGTDSQEETWALYLPAGTEFDGRCRITIDGDDYEAVGPPWEAFNPRLRRVTHIEATVRRVT